MSNDDIVKPVETKPTGPIKNRKQRRFEAKLARSRKEHKSYGPSYWVKRIIVEMKDSPRVKEAVISGKLDKYLEQ